MRTSSPHATTTLSVRHTNTSHTYNLKSIIPSIPKTFLTSSVPNLKLYSLAIEFCVRQQHNKNVHTCSTYAVALRIMDGYKQQRTNSLDLEIDTNGGDETLSELIVTMQKRDEGS